MARDICFEEHCWEWDEIFYEPVEGKKLLVWPPIQCIKNTGDPSNYCKDRSSEAREFLRSLRERYGFSLLYTRGDYCTNLLAAEAGWTKDQIVIDLADGRDLKDLVAFEEQWNQLWNMQHQPSPPPPPPFHAIFYDEPWEVEKNDIWSDTNIFLSEIPKDLCTNYEKYNEIFKDIKSMRLALLSLYIHECLRTEFVIGSHGGYRLDILQINQHSYPSGGIGERWIDCAMSTHWDWVGDPIDQIDMFFGGGIQYDDDQLDEQALLNGLGIGCNKAFISIQHNKGIFKEIFERLAEGGNFLTQTNELWLYSYTGGIPSGCRWGVDICQCFLDDLQYFCSVAEKAGWLRIREKQRKRRCESYEIPGCREKTPPPSDPAFYPFRPDQYITFP